MAAMLRRYHELGLMVPIRVTHQWVHLQRHGSWAEGVGSLRSARHWDACRCGSESDR